MDVWTEIVIDRPRRQVAEWAADPTRAPLWYRNIKRVEWRSPPPLRVGTRVAFVAQFLRRRLEYTYEVVQYLPQERLVMRADDGPFPMETTYEWSDADYGRTRMRLRNRGMPSGFATLLAPFMGWMVRRENARDLRLLKRILELR